ncbi:hypothetical protein Tco_0133471 [Tanacetum coccineum]
MHSFNPIFSSRASETFLVQIETKSKQKGTMLVDLYDFFALVCLVGFVGTATSSGKLLNQAYSSSSASEKTLPSCQAIGEIASVIDSFISPLKLY